MLNSFFPFIINSILFFFIGNLLCLFDTLAVSFFHLKHLPLLPLLFHIHCLLGPLLWCLYQLYLTFLVTVFWQLVYPHHWYRLLFFMLICHFMFYICQFIVHVLFPSCVLVCSMRNNEVLSDITSTSITLLKWFITLVHFLLLLYIAISFLCSRIFPNQTCVFLNVTNLWC